MRKESIQINQHTSPLVQDLLAKTDFTQLAVLTDANTKRYCYPLIKDQLPAHSLLEVGAGEASKNIDTCIVIWKKLTDLNFDRHSILLVLGGGVLGDMGGFCAATYKRGIRFILMPTTLLAQVDASIGGKLGIDFDHYKNHIGVFQQPLATLVHPPFLLTLPERELRSGFAEIIKHCLIADGGMWQTIRSKNLKSQDWEQLIPHSIDIKAAITDQDPTETGLRKTLNFGHTLGHSLETFFLQSKTPLFHGEAVAIGMILESAIAFRKALLSEPELTEIKNYIIEIFGKEKLPTDFETLLKLTLQDKKNKGNKILMALPQGLGKCLWDEPVTQEEIMSALDYYRSL